MSVNKSPEDSGGVSLDLRMLVGGRKERQQARQELLVLNEVNFIHAVVFGGIAEEKEDGGDQLLHGAHTKLTELD